MSDGQRQRDRQREQEHRHEHDGRDHPGQPDDRPGDGRRGEQPVGRRPAPGAGGAGYGGAPRGRGGVLRDRRPRYMPRDQHGRERSSSAGWIIGIVVIVLIGAALWFFLTRGQTSTPVPGVNGAQNAQSGQIVTDTTGQDISSMPGSGADLSSLENQTVTGTNVPIESVAGANEVWVGTSASRWFVYMATPPTTQVQPSGTLSFRGTVRPLPLDFESRFGLDPQTALGLQQMGYYIDTSTGTASAG